MASLKLFSMYLFVVHSTIAAWLLCRNARIIAKWRIRFYRALIGQSLVSAITILAGTLLVEAIGAEKLISETAFMLKLVLFILLWGACQRGLIDFLLSNEQKKYISPWILPRVCIATLMQTTFFYICIGVAVLAQKRFSI